MHDQEKAYEELIRRPIKAKRAPAPSPSEEQGPPRPRTSAAYTSVIRHFYELLDAARRSGSDGDVRAKHRRS